MELSFRLWPFLTPRRPPFQPRMPWHLSALASDLPSHRGVRTLGRSYESPCPSNSHSSGPTELKATSHCALTSVTALKVSSFHRIPPGAGYTAVRSISPPPFSCSAFIPLERYVLEFKRCGLPLRIRYVHMPRTRQASKVIPSAFRQLHAQFLASSFLAEILSHASLFFRRDEILS